MLPNFPDLESAGLHLEVINVKMYRVFDTVYQYTYCTFNKPKLLHNLDKRQHIRLWPLRVHQSPIKPAI